MFRPTPIRPGVNLDHCAAFQPTPLRGCRSHTDATDRQRNNTLNPHALSACRSVAFARGAAGLCSSVNVWKKSLENR